MKKKASTHFPNASLAGCRLVSPVRRCVVSRASLAAKAAIESPLLDFPVTDAKVMTSERIYATGPAFRSWPLIVWASTRSNRQAHVRTSVRSSSLLQRKFCPTVGNP